MATIAGTGSMLSKGVHRKFWETMGNADVGSPLDCADLPDKTVQITGTHGGATTTIKGSNDGVNYQTLTDPQGNALSFTTGLPAMETIQENPRFIRPETTGGATTDIDVTIISRATPR